MHERLFFVSQTKKCGKFWTLELLRYSIRRCSVYIIIMSLVKVDSPNVTAFDLGRGQENEKILGNVSDSTGARRGPKVKLLKDAPRNNGPWV